MCTSNVIKKLMYGKKEKSNDTFVRHQ